MLRGVGNRFNKNRGILANPGSTFKEISASKKKEKKRTTNVDKKQPRALPHLSYFFLPFFGVEKAPKRKRRRRRSEC